MKQFQQNLDSFENRFDSFVDSKQGSIQKVVDEHHAKMRQQRDTLKTLQAQKVQFEQQAAILQKQLENENEEVDTFREKISEMSQKKRSETEECTSLKIQVHTEKKKVEEQLKEVQQAQKELEARIKGAKNGVFFYEDRLKLKFEVMQQDYLRFVFTHIDADDVDREFLFTVSVDEDDQYHLVECKPMIPKVQKLIDEVNETNQFSDFVIAMRRKFVESLQ
eukprot:TRINITY_DN23067_c0_g1_i1.p1 TRINITY_DN23067_c0_g1~~TRINITY_DN23067_c0_g1_i1.p1  ORF type:complete len:237 (-),score=97.03 TRINITY_DN23067_c0_g1_i1:24-686(-)